VIKVTPAFSLLPSLLSLSCSAQTPSGPADKSPQPTPIDNAVKVETVAQGLNNPWGLEILPDGRFLVTEKRGTMRVVTRDGKVGAPLTGVPQVDASGQGGLLDVTLDPNFATSKLVFFSFSEPGPGNGTAGTAAARGRLTETGLEDVKVIYRQEPKVTGGNHYGSRVVFAPDGKVFITQGERFSYRDQAQDLKSLLGKVIRINPDGTIPNDNPFVGKDARGEIWSYGHRNVQGAAIDPATGRLWTIEHGAAGGDELNHPEPGKNYGWPVITYGRDYNGSKIGVGAVKEGMEQPVYYWDPVIAPSGMIFYTGDKFPQWKNNMFVGGLASNALVRLELTNGRVTKEERYLHDLHERIRDVKQGLDGYIYVITDNGMGRILRVMPQS
jgi:glucose/arabinose dehydrogenase